MIGIIALLARWGVPESLRRPLTYLGAAIALLALLWALRGCYDHAVVQRYQAKVEAQSGKAREQAADERTADAVINTRKEEDLHHAINAAPTGGALSPAAHALACERLRARNRIPAACRSAGGSGAQAGPG